MELWQLVPNDTLSSEWLYELSNSELSAMMASRNEILSGKKENVVFAAMKILQKLTNEHHDEYCDESDSIDYTTTEREDGSVRLAASIDGEEWCEIVIYPVILTHV